MKTTPLMTSLALLMATQAWAADPMEYGQVVSVTPVLHQITLPQQVCQPAQAGGQDTSPCSTQMVHHDTTTYQVAYDYAGRRYQVELPYDPGPTIALSVSPAVAPPTGYPATGYPPLMTGYPPPVAVPSTIVMPPPPPLYTAGSPVYVTPAPYYAYPYGIYPTIGIGVRFGMGYPRHYRR
jgi:hypothetical protein